MNRPNWSKPVTDSEAHRRAGGRLRYNRQRQGQAFLRGLNVFLSFHYSGRPPAEIAVQEQVSLATVYRDLEKWGGGVREYRRARKVAKQLALAKAKERGWL